MNISISDKMGTTAFVNIDQNDSLFISEMRDGSMTLIITVKIEIEIKLNRKKPKEESSTPYNFITIKPQDKIKAIY